MGRYTVEASAPPLVLFPQAQITLCHVEPVAGSMFALYAGKASKETAPVSRPTSYWPTAGELTPPPVVNFQALVPVEALSA